MPRDHAVLRSVSPLRLRLAEWAHSRRRTHLHTRIHVLAAVLGLAVGSIL
ncbi:hypothetical protein ACFQE5_18700 [Pseudonocardia hispaniensis]|uniref:Uncharacterized protein n=1 Tax=Pseudonocardia hispaniensis TaxID=904933 RepID=A0ABW1J5Y3_9PSEU